MAAKSKGGVRRNQLITTYGVGAIVATGDESVMVAGIDRWPTAGPNIHEPRLERLLSVRGFVLPPAGGNGRDIPVIRFPKIYYCPKCKRLDRHGFFTRFEDNHCNICRVPLVPSRFVVVCEHGHIDDFPYFEWIHKGTAPGDANEHILSIEAGGASASLSDIVIKCSCGKASTMNGAFARNALAGVRGCTGRRPWLGDTEKCNHTPRTLQRGASNVYFALVRSALSIPPWSEGAYKLINRYWHTLRHIPVVALAPTIKGMKLAEQSSYTVEDLVAAVLQRKSEQTSDATNAAQSETTLRRQEYEALMHGKRETDPEQEFVCVPASGLNPHTEEWFSQVMLVKRLREVRALEAFTRLQPPSPADPPERRAPLAKDSVDWLPAIEVLGEGVFLRLNEARLADWEMHKNVQERAARIDISYRRRFNEFGAEPDRSITPRLLLIHTLAHILIDQWALASGYPAASLRERLYVDETMCGILIYTAVGDSAGSLGGVVAQADKGHLWEALNEAIFRAAWCSSDPLCIETEAAGVDSLNLAACHACILLPEISCEHGNTLLDRGLLIGTPDDPSLGFFVDLLQ